MTDIEEYIAENQPVDQDDFKKKFGTDGLAEVRQLMESNKVSYNLDWDLVHEQKSPT